MYGVGGFAMRSGLAGLALGIFGGAVAPAVALDLDVAGISVGVGLGSGVDVGIGVGSVADVGLSAGSGGVSAGISLGTGPADAPTPPGAGASLSSGPSRDEVMAAKKRNCVGPGNSSVYDDYIVYDRAGLAVGVVRSASVGTDLRVQRLTVATLDSFVRPAECLTLSDSGVRIGAGAMRLSMSGNTLLRAIANR